MYCYLKNMKHFKVRFRTDEPEYSDLPDIPNYDDWRDTAYGHHTEELPTDAPVPLGKRVILTHYYDDSLMHDVLSEKPLLEYSIFIIRRQSTLIPRSKLLLKQQRMVQNLYPAGPVLNTPLIIAITFNI